MARISLSPRKSLTLRLGSWFSRRTYGKVLEPALVYGHQPRILRSYFSFEMKVAKWNALDKGLKHLAEMATAAKIGCAWCMDFGYWASDQDKLPLEKISKVPAWRDHRDAFSELELLVLEYAEAVTDTPPTVTDELTEQLQRHLGEAAFVELTAMIAVENLRSRVNSAAGLTSQGFSDSCAVPPVTARTEG